MVYSVSADGHVVKWQIGGNEDGQLVLQTNEAFYSVYFDKGTGVLYGGTQSGNVYAIDLQNTKLLWQKQLHKGGVFFIAVHQGVLISGGGDGVLKVGEESVKLSAESLRSILLAEDTLWIGSSDNRIYAVSLDSLEVTQRINGHTNSVFALTSEDDNHLFSSGRDAMIKIWDKKTFQCIREVPAHNYQVTHLDILDGMLLSSSMDKSIRIWNDQLELLKVIDNTKMNSHTNCINKVRWLDDRMFVSCSDDRSLRVWQIELNS